MLIPGMSSKRWEDNFMKKFVSFAKKSPVQISVGIRVQQGERGILITHQNSNTKYFYPFDYDGNIKDFIARIKKDLVSNHYPRVAEEILEKYELTPEEMAIELERGVKPTELQNHKMRTVGIRQFLIDKILLWKNIFILKLENSTFPEDEIGKLYRYKYEGPAVTYLKNYRSGRFKSIEQASDAFFSNSIIIDSIEETKSI